MSQSLTIDFFSNFSAIVCNILWLLGQLLTITNYVWQFKSTVMIQITILWFPSCILAHPWWSVPSLRVATFMASICRSSSLSTAPSNYWPDLVSALRLFSGITAHVVNFFCHFPFLLFRYCKQCKAESSVRCGSIFEKLPRVPLSSIIHYFWLWSNDVSKKYILTQGNDFYH